MTSFVPSMLSVFVSETGGFDTDSFRSLRVVLAAGEALPLSVVRTFELALPGVALHNLYGPTEFTVHATEGAVGSDRGIVTIGSPVWNTRAYVLDQRLYPVPVGVAGELYLSGPQVARGYVSRPDLTAGSFVADPFVGADAGASRRMYRTGDLVRWTNNGEIEYVGRTDFQVKLRGLRIELGEIEAVLTDADSVSRAVVLVRNGRLVGYLVGESEKTIDFGDLSALAASRLPSYMVPSDFVVLEDFPLGSSGKLDRKALPDPVVVAKEFRAPTTPVEEIVADTFAGVLGVERVGLDDDFFELGGNSLIATR